MASIEEDALKGMLQALEHTLTHYEQQFAALTTQREHMRTVIARWWTLLEDRAH